MKDTTYVVVIVSADGQPHVYGRDQCCNNAPCPFPDRESAIMATMNMPPDAERIRQIVKLEGI